MWWLFCGGGCCWWILIGNVGVFGVGGDVGNVLGIVIDGGINVCFLMVGDWCGWRFVDC